MLTWLLQLKPQEKKEIRFSIRVTRPRNSRIADFE
jgi:hypothetical protein